GLKSRRVKQEIKWTYIYSICYISFFGALLYMGHFGHFLALYLPTILIVFLIEELANLPHHAETPLLNPDDKALPYWEQHRVTHSCRTVPVWSQFILLNFNLHTAHHWFPAAPWYSLPALNKAMQESAPHVIEHETQNELEWSLQNRKRPLLNIMGHYFDKVPTKLFN
ncbi:MAG: fatty acid desaturase, partial [Pseudobdellovibrio sp.]